MIKTRLIGLLGQAKKYIGYNILFQWIALIAQIVASFQAADLIARILDGRTTTVILVRTAVILSRTFMEKPCLKGIDLIVSME